MSLTLLNTQLFLPVRPLAHHPLLQSRPEGETTLANLSGIVKQLKKERDRVQHQLSGLKRLRKRAGQKSRGSRRSFQLLSPSELCQHRLGARLLRLNWRGGRRSSERT